MKKLFTFLLNPIIRIIIVACIFIVCMVLKYTNIKWYIVLPIAIVGYVYIAYDIWIKTFKRFIKKDFFNEYSLMMLASIAAFLIFAFPGGEMEFPEAIAVVLLYQIGELLQDKAIDKSKQSIKSLLNLKPLTVLLCKNNETFKVSPDTIKIGDIILVNPGDRIALDGIIVSGDSSLDLSTINGESIPKHYKINDEVISGAINLSSPIQIQVTKDNKNSTLTKIIAIVKKASESKSKTENMINRFTKWYTPLVFCLAIIFAIIPPLCINLHSSATWFTWIRTGVVILILSCPCALVISIPLSFFSGIGVSSKYGILIKGANYIESLAKANKVIFDKTGTLTKGVFEVNHIHIYDKNINRDELIDMVAHIECFSTHPIGLSIVKEFKGTIDRNNVKDMKTIPGQGLIGKYKNHKIVIGNKELLESYNINVIEDNCGSTTVFIASDHKFIASICVGDSIKQESKQCIDLLNKMNIQPILLSGDNQQTVEKVTKTLNISKYKYSLTPIEKVNYLEQQLKNSNSKIVFCGDGVNDAPALAKADVGISMGNIGSDLAIETSDVVITNDNVLKILEVITISKRTVKTARMNMIFALAIKAIVFIFTIVSGFVISQTLETASLWIAVFADVGVTLIAILIAFTIFLYKPNQSVV